MQLFKQPEREFDPSVCRRPQGMAVQRYAGRSRDKCNHLYNGRECEGKRSKRLPISETTAGEVAE